MSNFTFIESVQEYNNAKEKFKKSMRDFKSDVIKFFMEYEIPIVLNWFGNSFGIDIRFDEKNFMNNPHSIPIKVLYEFCEEFGCEFDHTACDGHRWIFIIDGLYDAYNEW